MKRPLLIALLAFGTLAGFGSGFFHMGARAHARRAAFERHVADVCAESALRVRSNANVNDHANAGQAGPRATPEAFQ